MKAKKDGVILHYWLLPSDQWMQSYELFRDNFPTFIPTTSFPICLVRIKTSRWVKKKTKKKKRL